MSVVATGEVNFAGKRDATATELGAAPLQLQRVADDGDQRRQRRAARVTDKRRRRGEERAGWLGTFFSRSRAKGRTRGNRDLTVVVGQIGR